MIEQVIKFLQSLVPNSNLPTRDYLARLTGLTAIIILLMMLIYSTLFGTVLGAKWGLEKKQPLLTNLSHYELVKDQRQIWQNLTLLRENDPSITGVFSIVLYDIQTGNILTKPEKELSNGLIYVASIPGEHFNSIDIIENAINKVRPKFQEKFSVEKTCYSGRLKGETLKILKRGIAKLTSTHYAVCPIYAKNGRYLIAATAMFIELPIIPTPLPDKKKGVKIENIDPNVLEEFVDLWGYQDRLQRISGSLEQSLNDFKTPYQFYY